MLEWHGAYLNLSDATLQYQEQKMELTKNEFRILQMLIENAGKIISRDNIITRLWESDEFIDDNTLTVNVARLRRKLERMGLKNVILTKKVLDIWWKHDKNVFEIKQNEAAVLYRKHAIICYSTIPV